MLKKTTGLIQNLVIIMFYDYLGKQNTKIYLLKHFYRYWIGTFNYIKYVGRK